IPVSTAEKVRDDMTALGVRSDLIVYPDQRHGFFNQEETGMYQATEQAMDDFMVSLGWLEPLP
ncbi:MAG: alpha/beta hydrolase, partial [Planctomycetota bacterium]